MTVSPLPRTRPASLPPGRAGSRRTPSRTSIVRRRQMVYWVKRLLPVAAVLLLGSIALWPEIVRQIEMNTIGNRQGADLQAGKLTNVRYRGIDERSRPYTVTASQAVQAGAERVNLVDPKGDLVSENGSWTMVQSNDGVYIQHAGLLDLSHDVRVYRDDGITLNTESATMDLKTGAAAGNEQTHAEGPFGTLDAQGFALVDKGAIIQFQGSSRLLLNEVHQ